MIQNDNELTATQERISRFQQWLREMRQRTPPTEFAMMSSGYRLEIERMQAEVLDYLLNPPLRADSQNAAPDQQNANPVLAVA